MSAVRQALRGLQFEHVLERRVVPSLNRATITFPPFDSGRALFCSHARQALWAILDLLDAGKDDVILVPDVLCAVVAATIVKHGVRARLYPVGQDLRADPDAIDRRISSDTRAVLVVNYFGFPQPYGRLLELCQDRAIHLIEDCAMALFSAPGGRPLGAYGDFSIFSFRKTLPIRDGAALVVRDPRSLPFLSDSPRMSLDIVERGKLSLLRAELLSRLPLHYVALGLRGLERCGVLGSGQADISSHHRLNLEAFFSPDQDLAPRPMSGSAWAVASGCDPEEIRRRRAANYHLLEERLASVPGVQPVFSELPEGVCPLYFPVYVQERDRVHQRLKAAGIPAWDVWPEAPKQLLELQRMLPNVLDSSRVAFSETAAITQGLLALPVHEGLGARQMSLVARAIAEAISN